MTYLSLKKWSGAFEVPGVVAKIRRIIQAHVDADVCVVVLDDGCRGLTEAIRQEIQEGWPAEKVRFSRVHPLASVVLTPRRNRSKRGK